MEERQGVFWRAFDFLVERHGFARIVLGFLAITSFWVAIEDSYAGYAAFGVMLGALALFYPDD